MLNDNQYEKACKIFSNTINYIASLGESQFSIIRYYLVKISFYILLNSTKVKDAYNELEKQLIADSINEAWIAWLENIKLYCDNFSALNWVQRL